MVSRFRARALASIALLILLCGCGSGTLAQAYRAASPAAQAAPAEAPAPEAPRQLAPAEPSGALAMAHVNHLAGVIGPRPAGLPGSVLGADYVAETLRSYGLAVERQPFSFPQFEERNVTLSVTSASGEVVDVTAHALVYSASGRVEGQLAFGGLGRPSEVRGTAGAVALIERGANITFREKAEAAASAGATAAIIYNNQPHIFTGSLQQPSRIPVVAVSGADGQRLRALLAAGPAAVSLTVDAGIEERTTENVIATIRGTAPDGHRRNVVIGAHMDSVQISPGANDNASGTAVILEIARVLAARPAAMDVTVIAFGAEELGLLGSSHYVRTLTPEARGNVAAMLNFDMVGVGDRLEAGGDSVLLGHVDAIAAARGLRFDRLGPETTGRSDHAAFMAAGIPSIFFYVSDDPNYHTPADLPAEVSPHRLEQIAVTGLDLVRRLS